MVDSYLQDGDLTRPRNVRLSQLFIADEEDASQQQIPEIPGIVYVFRCQTCPRLVEGLQHLQLKHGLKIPTSVLITGLAIQSHVQRSAQR